MDWGILTGIVAMMLTAIILIVLIWQLFSTRRAHAVLARDEAYRKLAEQATKAQQQTAEAQQQIAENIADLRPRVERIEKLLSEVE